MDTELRKKYEISPEKLRYKADPKEFKSTDKIETSLEAIIIGQEKAIESIQTGLKLDDKHSNIFITGQSGLGKDEIVRTVITEYIKNLPPEEYKQKIRQRKDLLAAYNFENPENPLILELPQGWGEIFGKELNTVVNYILKDGIKKYEKQFETNFLQCNIKAQEANNKLKAQQSKLQKESQKIQAEISKLDKLLQEAQPESKESIEYQKKIDALNQEFDEMDRDSLDRELKLQAELNTLQSQNDAGQKNAPANYRNTVVKPVLDKLRQSYNIEKVKKYLDQFEKAIMVDVETEIKVAHISVGAKMGATNSMMMQMPLPPDTSPYQVKILNKIKPEEQIKGIPATIGIPVIFDKKPTLEGMFGTIEASKQFMSPMGMEKAKKDQHLRLEAGSYIKALGGYLVVDMMKIVQKDIVAFERLIEDLDSGKTNIENFRLRHYVPTISEDIDSKIKVIIIGNNSVYQQLKGLSSQEYFKEFDKVFNIKSELDSVTENIKKTR